MCGENLYTQQLFANAKNKPKQQSVKHCQSHATKVKIVPQRDKAKARNAKENETPNIAGMNFSYMKIAIYVLTFITYAYSGYGSSTIAHLRDAIIAAEAIFGDVFSNLITLSKKFRTVHEVFDAAVEETCIFKCPTEPGAPGKYPACHQLCR